MLPLWWALGPQEVDGEVAGPSRTQAQSLGPQPTRGTGLGRARGSHRGGGLGRTPTGEAEAAGGAKMTALLGGGGSLL